MDEVDRQIRVLLLHKKRLLLLIKKRQRKSTTRKYWVHPVNQRRNSHGLYANLVREIRAFGRYHHRYFRMTATHFDQILSLIAPAISGQDTTMRKAISPGLKLVITLHHLAEGSSHSTIALHYRLGRSTVSKIVYQTCDAIWEALHSEYLKPPSGPADWVKVAQGFQDTWHFPNCIGSIDGKHVVMQKPKHAGSEYHNYKQTESIVLMGICDSAYKFIFVDIGQSGSQSDGGIWELSTLGSALLHGRINLPNPSILPGDSSGVAIPYTFVADEAFPLKPYLMRPFPGKQLGDDSRRVFNYRLSRARRVIENTFGILVHRWRLLLRPTIAEPPKVVKLVKAACVLHNFLRTVQDQQHTPQGFVDAVDVDGNIREGFWRASQLATLGDLGYSSRSATQEGDRIRKHLVTYFSNEGTVPWQLAHIHAR